MEDPVVKAHEFDERFKREVFPHIRRFLQDNKEHVNNLIKNPERAGAEHIGLLILLQTMKEHDRHAIAYGGAKDRLERKDRLYWMAVKKFQIMQALRDILKYHLERGTPYTIDENWAKAVVRHLNGIEREYKNHYMHWLGFVVTPNERKAAKNIEDILSQFPEL